MAGSHGGRRLAGAALCALAILVSVAVFRGTRRLVLRRGHSLGSVTLRRPPRGRYRVKLVARDSRGRTRVARHRISNC